MQDIGHSQLCQFKCTSIKFEFHLEVLEWVSNECQWVFFVKKQGLSCFKKRRIDSVAETALKWKVFGTLSCYMTQNCDLISFEHIHILSWHSTVHPWDTTKSAADPVVGFLSCNGGDHLLHKTENRSIAWGLSESL